MSLTVDKLMAMMDQIKALPAKPAPAVAWLGANFGGADILGTQIVTSLLMVDMVEDWSRVRSPSRARRRMKYGHKQNIDMRAIPKKESVSMDGGRSLVMHPEVAKEIERMIGDISYGAHR